jgi:hypothetical protein
LACIDRRADDARRAEHLRRRYPGATAYDVQPENHKAIIRSLFDDVWRKSGFDQVSLYLAPGHEA